MIQITKTTIWYPRYVANTILDIDKATLARQGITHIAFDLDKTLLARGARRISPSYVRHIQSLRQAGFTILIGSNARREIRPVVQALDVAVVLPKGLSMKPFGSFYKRLIAAAGTTPDHIVMVGDHIINDAIGGNRAGCTTILVRGLRQKTSLAYRLYMRIILGRVTSVT
ncbi:MAG TPA: HAD hydrolase-like protein [Candidatus Saccharimonadales bacterium]|nr:HAD hydrolase-like protein [Candidatus Saccharimonadales bacterium]